MVYCIYHSLQWLSIKRYFNYSKLNCEFYMSPTYIISVIPKECTEYTAGVDPAKILTASQGHGCNRVWSKEVEGWARGTDDKCLCR